jgi:enoyl-CoA hydratase/carnithine racemase
MSDILQVQARERVLWLTLNRPEKRNALNSDLCRLLVDTIGKADRDPQVGAIVLTANGPAFSAGMDLDELGNLAPGALSNVHEQLFTLNARIVTPILASVTGPALGGGLGLVANCHIVVANEAARFGLTEVKLGIWPFLVFRAVKVALGERRAVALALTGRIFDAPEAKELGLVQEIHPEPEKRVLEIAAEIAGYSPTAIRSGLGFVQEVRGKSWDIAGLIARRVREELFQSADFYEGIRAFREKRKPQWPSAREHDDYPGDQL